MKTWYVIIYAYASKRYLIFAYNSKKDAEDMVYTILKVYKGHKLTITSNKKLVNFFNW